MNIKYQTIVNKAENANTVSEITAVFKEAKNHVTAWNLLKKDTSFEVTSKMNLKFELDKQSNSQLGATIEAVYGMNSEFKFAVTGISDKICKGFLKRQVNQKTKSLETVIEWKSYTKADDEVEEAYESLSKGVAAELKKYCGAKRFTDRDFDTNISAKYIKAIRTRIVKAITELDNMEGMVLALQKADYERQMKELKEKGSKQN